MSSEVISKIEAISAAYSANTKAINDNFLALNERLERIEAGGDRPRGLGAHYSAEDNEHKSVFLDWVRKPTDPRRVGRLSEAQHELAKKDVTIGSAPGGGYGLPKEISAQIEQRVRQLNPFRKLVDVVSCGTNDFHSLVSMGDGTSGWSSETGTRSATASPTLRDVAPTFGEQFALPTASTWSLNDLFFNVQQWLVDDISADWAAQEATAIISGTGSSQPTGILKTNPTASADNASPMRGQDIIQFVGMSSYTSPVTKMDIDSLIDVVSTVRERYLQETDRIAWAMHRLTVAKLRKLKAVTAGTFLWEPDAQAGTPLTLLGYPVVTCDAMPVVALNAFPIVFGNWRRGYLLADRVGMNIVVDPYSTPGQVRYYVSRRLGGRIKNNDALKALRIA